MLRLPPRVEPLAVALAAAFPFPLLGAMSGIGIGHRVECADTKESRCT